MPLSSVLLYLIFLAAVWAFRLAYIGWLGPYLVAAAALVPPLLFLLSLPSMRALRLELSAPATCAKGSETALRLRFLTASRLPLSCVAVELETENRFTGEVAKQSYRFRSILASDGAIPLPTEDCGLLICRVLSYECYDLLGLFRLRHRCPDLVKCAVLPHAAGPETPPDIEAAMNAALRLKPKYGGGYSEEHDLRAYQPGDTVNSIHWKLSSKTDSVIVREPLIAENNEVYLVLAQAGVGDRGLEVLYWLSLELCRLEIPHILVSARQYPVSNEAEAREAMAGILSGPMAPPRTFDRSLARCVFLISGGEVKTV